MKENGGQIHSTQRQPDTTTRPSSSSNNNSSNRPPSNSSASSSRNPRYISMKIIFVKVELQLIRNGM